MEASEDDDEDEDEEDSEDEGESGSNGEETDDDDDDDAQVPFLIQSTFMIVNCFFLFSFIIRKFI